MRLDVARIEPLLRAALREDIGSGDVTTRAAISPGARGLGVVVCKAEGICAGLPVAARVFACIDTSLEVRAQVHDGCSVGYGDVLMHIQGAARAILSAERVALNFLQRLSGIATLTGRFVAAVDGTRARFLDTRKTTPGLRVLEKYAVRMGGGENHRFGLDDQVLIKDNHLEAAGGVRRAVELLRKRKGRGVFIEVEVKTPQEVEAAVEVGVNRILLDNMRLDRIREMVHYVRERTSARRQPIQIEASGGITLENVRAVADAGVDYISVGALTHSAPALDMSLQFRSVG
jgi:nicotinate-nucleotide pyrophosphorylase (carboxylating)